MHSGIECRNAHAAQCAATAEERRLGLGARLRGLWRHAMRMRAAAAERRALADLDDRMLRDIGLSDQSRRREMARPFWDIP